MTDSNRRQTGCKPVTLPTELIEYICLQSGFNNMHISSVSTAIPDRIALPAFVGGLARPRLLDKSISATALTCMVAWELVGHTRFELVTP